MKKEIPSTLAIYPNNVGYGYAFFETANTLTDCGISYVRPISNAKCLKRIRQFLEYYKPSVIVLEDYEAKGARKSKRVEKLIRNIEALAVEKKLEIKKYSREQVRFVFQQFKAETKYEIAKVLVTFFPQLKHRTPSYRKLWMAEDHNMGMFDAISLAVTYFYVID